MHGKSISQFAILCMLISSVKIIVSRISVNYLGGMEGGRGEGWKRGRVEEGKGGRGEEGWRGGRGEEGWKDGRIIYNPKNL